MASEYRLIWRRESGYVYDHETGADDYDDSPGPLRSRIYQRRAPAERLALILQGRMAEATGLDPDDFACCSGWECGCGGKTNAEVWAEKAEEIPPLVEGPTIQRREVGKWEAAPASPAPPQLDASAPRLTSQGAGRCTCEPAPPETRDLGGGE
jgi:hypothetical protein